MKAVILILSVAIVIGFSATVENLVRSLNLTSMEASEVIKFITDYNSAIHPILLNKSKIEQFLNYKLLSGQKDMNLLSLYESLLNQRSSITNFYKDAFFSILNEEQKQTLTKYLNSRAETQEFNLNVLYKASEDYLMSSIPTDIQTNIIFEEFLLNGLNEHKARLIMDLLAQYSPRLELLNDEINEIENDYNDATTSSMDSSSIKNRLDRLKNERDLMKANIERKLTSVLSNNIYSTIKTSYKLFLRQRIFGSLLLNKDFLMAIKATALKPAVTSSY